MAAAAAVLAVLSASLPLAVAAVTVTRCRTHVDPGIRWTVNCSGLALASAPAPLNLHPVITLVLSRNNLTDLTESFFTNWTDILLLDLSHNNIHYIDADAFKGLTDLTELNLMHNQIEVLSTNVTSYLTKLKILNLSSNKLKVIMPQTFNSVPSLLRLILRHNLLGDDPENFDALNVTLIQSLIHLDIANTSLSQLPEDMFDSAHSLIALNMAQNPLAIIPRLPQSLRQLNLTGTMIKTITPGLFSECGLLQRLSLEGMPLLAEVGEDAFSGLTHLEELFMSGSPRLSVVSPAVFGTTSPPLKLREVSLAHCALSTLPSSLEPWMIQVEHLDLQHNPWLCDGRMAWLIDINILDNLTNDLRCENPPTARGMLVLNFFKPRSHPHSSLIRGGIVVAMVAILVASVVALIRHSSKEKGKTYRHLQSITLQERCRDNISSQL